MSSRRSNRAEYDESCRVNYRKGINRAEYNKRLQGNSKKRNRAEYVESCRVNYRKRMNRVKYDENLRGEY